MGKSSSKHKQETETDSSKVKKRNKKKNEKKARPVSDPGAGAHLDFPTNFSTLPKPEEGGRHVDLTGKSRPYTTAGTQNVPDLEDYVDPEELEREMKQRKATETEQREYGRSLDAALLVWPEYDALRDIEVGGLRGPVVDTMTKILTRLYEQHHLIQSLSREKRDVALSLAELEDENAARRQREDGLAFTVRNLEEDLAILKGELRKRGVNPKLPPRSPTSPREPSGREHRASESSAASGGGDERAEKLRRREREGIYQATPMIQMFGDKDRMKAAVKRTPSQLKAAGRAAPRGGGGEDGLQRAGSTKTGTEAGPTKVEVELAEVRARLRTVEEELQRERDDNSNLRNRLDTAPAPAASSSPRSSEVEAVYGRALTPLTAPGLSREALEERFTSLENEALGRVTPALERLLAGVSRARRDMFVCAVIETAYSAAKKSVAHFEDVLTALLQNPTTTSLASHVTRSQSFLSGGGGGSKYKSKDSAGAAAGSSGHMSALAKRTAAVAEYPELLRANILTYLEHASSSTSLSPLQERTTDELAGDYSDCVTPAVLNSADVRDFLERCCRLAWQMNLVRPPLYVSSEFYTRFDDRYHTTYDVPAAGDLMSMRVDYYRWPILLDRKHGDVVHKGLVVLKP